MSINEYFLASKKVVEGSIVCLHTSTVLFSALLLLTLVFVLWDFQSAYLQDLPVSSVSPKSTRSSKSKQETFHTQTCLSTRQIGVESKTAFVSRKLVYRHQ